MNGYRVPADDEQALADALRKVAADPAWRVEAGERSRELTAGYTGDAWAACVVPLARENVRDHSKRRIALLTEIPAPYRIPLFNALAASPGMNLRVLFLAQRDPRREYPVYDREFSFDRSVLKASALSCAGAGSCSTAARTVSSICSTRTSCCSAAGTSRRSGRVCAGRGSTTGRSCSGSKARCTTSAAARSCSSALKRRAVAAASGFLVPGRAAREYVESLGVPDERIVIAPNAVDLSIFGQEPKRDHREECTFLYVGRLASEKGIDVLLDAFDDVPGTLLLAG